MSPIKTGLAELAALAELVAIPGASGVVLTVPKDDLPPSFPRGELLHETERGGRIVQTYKFDPNKVRDWLNRNRPTEPDRPDDKALKSPAPGAPRPGAEREGSGERGVPAASAHDPIAHLRAVLADRHCSYTEESDACMAAARPLLIALDDAIAALNQTRTDRSRTVDTSVAGGVARDEQSVTCLTLPALPESQVIASGRLGGRPVELRGWYEDELLAWASRHGIRFAEPGDAPAPEQSAPRMMPR